MAFGKQDEMQIEILEDGRIVINSMGKISAANHMTAEQLLRNIQDLTGAKVEIVHKHGAGNPAVLRRQQGQG